MGVTATPFEVFGGENTLPPQRCTSRKAPPKPGRRETSSERSLVSKGFATSLVDSFEKQTGTLETPGRRRLLKIGWVKEPPRIVAGEADSPRNSGGVIVRRQAGELQQPIGDVFRLA